LIVGRRCDRKVAVSDYLPCIYCKTFYLSHDLSRHAKNCKFEPNHEAANADEVAIKGLVSQSRMLLEGAVKQKYRPTSEKFREEILETMRCDNSTDIVKQDELIIKFGSSLHSRLGRNRCHDISQRMRQLARLVQEVNRMHHDERGRNISLEQCLTGEMFDQVLEATKSLCVQFEDSSGRVMFRSPNLGLKLGHTLVKCCHLKLGLALRASNSSMHSETKAFLQLHKADWLNYISSASLASLKHRK
jgi:hypothetical protein